MQYYQVFSKPLSDDAQPSEYINKGIYHSESKQALVDRLPKPTKGRCYTIDAVQKAKQ